MRLIFTTLFLILFNVFIVAQENSELNKIWVANDLKCLDLRIQNEAYFDYGLGVYGKFKLKSTDTVFYMTGERQLGYIEITSRSESIGFRIERLTKDTLIIHPLNINAKALLETDYKNHFTKYNYGDTVLIHKSDKYTFLSKERMFDKDFEFDKIYFSNQSGIIGTQMNLEIDNKGHILFKGISNTGEYKGKYSGRLPRKELNNLKNILKFSAVDKIPEKLLTFLDHIGPNYKMIISYNGTIKKTEGHSFPYFNKPLYEFLINIYKHSKLKINDNVEFTLPNIKS